MNRTFLVNLIFVIAINVLVKPLYIFGIDVSVQNTVGTEVYGLFFVLLNFTYLFQIINDFGIQIYNSRRIAQDPSLIQTYLPSFLTLKLVLALIFSVVIWLIAMPMGYSSRWSLLLPIIGMQILISLNLYLRSNISALGHYRTDSILSVLDKIVMILVLGYLLFFSAQKESFSIYWFIYTQLGALFLTTLTAASLVFRKIRGLGRWKNLRIKELLKESGPYALAVFLMTIYTRVDSVMVQKLLADGEMQAGIYAAAYRIFDAFNMVAFLFAVLLLPMFSKLLNDREALLNLLQLGFRLMISMTVVIAISLYFSRDALMDLLYVSANAYWGSVFGYLILSFIGVGLMYVLSTFLTAQGSIKTLNMLFAFAVVVNILLNFFMIPRLKAEGAALATFITQFGVAAILLYLVQRELNSDSFRGLVMRTLLFGALAVLAGSLVHYFLPISWIFAGFLTALTCLVLAFVFKLLDVKSVFQLFQLSGEDE